ncbi:MAG: hypothetical protein Q7J03_03010 [Methanoregula sp.]|nr:hypothetical protein [Methanoregula sp.]
MRTICILALFTLLLLLCGCTQQTPYSPVAQTAPVDESPVVLVSQPDSSHILITYPGSLQTDKLVELEVSITDSNGKAVTQSMGSRLATTPIPYGSSRTFTGSFEGTDKVFVTGYFSDGSQKRFVDSTI